MNYMSDYLSWTRVEPDHKATDPRPGARVPVADPFWSLGRQWWIGELEGFDGGSPQKRPNARPDAVRQPQSRPAPSPQASNYGSQAPQASPLPSQRHESQGAQQRPMAPRPADDDELDVPDFMK